MCVPCTAAREEDPLLRDMHVQYFVNVLKVLPSALSSLDTNRLSLVRRVGWGGGGEGGDWSGGQSWVGPGRRGEDGGRAAT